MNITEPYIQWNWNVHNIETIYAIELNCVLILFIVRIYRSYQIYCYHLKSNRKLNIMLRKCCSFTVIWTWYICVLYIASAATIAKPPWRVPIKYLWSASQTFYSFFSFVCYESIWPNILLTHSDANYYTYNIKTKTETKLPHLDLFALNVDFLLET